MSGETSRALLCGVAVAGIVLLCGGPRAVAQMSPGPLAAAHQSIDGPLACFQCHAKGKGKAGMDAQCLACHREVAWMRAQKRGFHANAATMRADCATCHPDHGGRAFALVAWDGGSPERFDHRRAGWALEGKHATLGCRECHTSKFLKSPALAATRVKRTSVGWIGLETACVSCHQDPHRKQLGSNCLSCHDQQKWKPAPGFDHEKTAYRLTGAHADVACAKCHATPAVARGVDAEGRPVPQWKPLPHGDCSACHKDPHAGRFRGTCASCHTTQTFHQIRTGSFDHDKTRYPLRGAHAAVSCARCHDEKKAWGAHPKFGRCDNCHTDAHNGLATVAGVQQDCAACHTVRAFHPSTYTVAQHQKTRYPLAGAHAAAACASCHDKRAQDASLGSARVAMRPAHAECGSCHVDPHAGRFASRTNGCLACHTMDRFRPSTYDERAHRTCVFPLEGAHRAVSCEACHAELKAPPGSGTLRAASARRLRFDRKERDCVDCHRDPHQAQFAKNAADTACQRCHGVDAFAPAVRFVHDRDTAFRLEGAHDRAACTACHKTERTAKGVSFVRYRPVPTRCEACHA